MAAKRPSSGLPADAQGNPAIDPTANVIALVDLNVKRLDDLRELDSTWTERMAATRAAHQAELAVKESARIDANRTTDLAAVQSAAAVTAASAQALAKTVVDTAEAARASQLATAVTVGETLTRTVEPLIRQIAELQRVQYEQAGLRAGVTETRVGSQVTFGQIVGVVAIVLTFLSIGLGALIAFTQ